MAATVAQENAVGHRLSTISRVANRRFSGEKYRHFCAARPRTSVVSVGDEKTAGRRTNLTHPRRPASSRVRVAVCAASVSQLHGAGRIADTGAVVRQALWIAVCGGATIAVLLQNVEPAYRLLGVDERTIPRCLASAPSSPNPRVSAALPWNKRVRGATAIGDGCSMVDERGRAAGEAEGAGRGALFGPW